MAKSVGRPKRTLKELPKDWKEQILNLKREGGSDVECRVLLNISIDLWERWIKEEPEFSETIKEGAALCEAWWLKAGRTGIYQTSGGKDVTHTNINPTLWYMNMKNRFGWRDKQEIDQTLRSTFEIIIKE